MNQNKNKSLKNIISHEDKEDQIEWLKDLLDICPREINRKSVSQWATDKRILLPGLTPYPGPFRWEVVPYAKEIADCFSEDSPIQKVAIMKGAQIAMTVGVLENILGYTIDHDPGPTMFISGDKEMAETAIELRIDRMLESAGIAHKIFSQTEKKHGRKTGDTKSKKEFPGGFLLPVGPNTGAKLRQFSVQKILFDEVDAYPAEVGEEGDPLILAERRTDAFERTRKILYISTPLVDGSSRIKTLYENGDQRKWFVPCKHCGEMQELKFDNLKYEQDEKGILIWDSVRYECEYCSKPWKNDDKIHFLGKGEWRPTSQAIEPNYRSYHLSSLYSPVGFRSWESIVQEWIGIKGDQSRLRTFVNTVLGETYQERGEAPPFAMIMLKREDYKVGTLPEESKPLLITMAADVQSDRIEAEVVAWGRDKESWSINYFVFYGDTNDLMSDAWQGLSEALTSEYCGKNVTMAFIDAGYRTSTVYQFCEQFPAGVFPVMGESSNAYGKKYFTLRDVAGFSVKRVDIQTSIFKSELYGYLQKGKPEEGNSYPLGYCHFPVEYGEKYFQMLTAEKRIPVRTKTGQTKLAWVQVRDRNEALDIRVYNMAALSFIADTLQAEIMPDEERLDWPTFWDLIESTNKT
jgi:phage terminase large subunit GpA-like protein